jgi:uncharacterized glyoxalase superfamily protein PhnB
MHTITTQLWFNRNCSDAIDFYRKAFGAEVVGDVARGPDGKSVMHAMVRIGDSNLMMSDAWPGQWEHAPKEGATAGLFVYVDDCDALHARATAAGCEVLFPMADMFWGDRMSKVKDPYGHCWAIATHKWAYTPEEVMKGQQEWLASMKK